MLIIDFWRHSTQRNQTQIILTANTENHMATRKTGCRPEVVTAWVVCIPNAIHRFHGSLNSTESNSPTSHVSWYRKNIAVRKWEVDTIITVTLHHRSRLALQCYLQTNGIRKHRLIFMYKMENVGGTKLQWPDDMSIIYSCIIVLVTVLQWFQLSAFNRHVPVRDKPVKMDCIHVHISLQHTI